jgi:hypothetical protein
MNARESGGSRWQWLWAAVAILALGLLWHQVFAMTGLLWWDATAAATKVTRPAAPHIQAPATGWVDVDAYLRTHPEWRS